MRKILTGQDQYLAPRFFYEWWDEFILEAVRTLQHAPPVHLTLKQRCGVTLWAPSIPAFDLFNMTWFVKLPRRGVNDNANKFYDAKDNLTSYFHQP